LRSRDPYDLYNDFKILFCSVYIDWCTVSYYLHCLPVCACVRR
jgi:hypothetical protein